MLQASSIPGNFRLGGDDMWLDGAFLRIITLIAL